ncbi:transmembrane protein 119-like [Stegostoma tigrinum]|uniref:transmembrane protein 119-like n=1 Tax=Stegostoma tigrinum TaxID=3053191 RepID=UPI00202B27A2|nr:transmembrane protein 119-like [Stegostoma tigrinum]XP_048412519.1 transmembrane protein 119-like [Stegostoma tigrinum]
MAIPLALWLLAFTTICPSTTYPSSHSPLSITPASAESSGSSESDISSTEITFSTIKVSTSAINADPVSANETTSANSKSVTMSDIMDFIKKYMNLFIIGGVLLILLVVVVCAIVLVRLNYKASAYYPSSYPKKKYVNEQDRGGSTKTFDEIPEKVNDEPGEDSKQLETDILAVTHNLKKKAPAKGEADTAKGEASQTPEKAGTNTTSQEAGGEGKTLNTIENKEDKAPGKDSKDDGNEELSKEKEQKGENKENDDEQGTGKGTEHKLESEEGPSTDSNQLSAGGIGSKSPKITSGQTADTADMKGIGNDSPESQEPQLAQQELNEAEPRTDNISDLENTPLILNCNGAPNDSRAF